MPFLAQIDTEALRRLVEYNETASVERQVLLVALVLMIIGMPILFILARGAVRQSSGILDVIKMQAIASQKSAETYERVMTEQKQVMHEQLDVLRALKGALDTNNAAILRVEDHVDKGHAAIDSRFQELQRLLNATAEETRRSFMSANEAYDYIRKELSAIAKLQQDAAESGVARFRTYEQHNGEQMKKLTEMTNALNSVMSTLSTLKLEVAHIRTSELKPVDLVEEKPDA